MAQQLPRGDDVKRCRAQAKDMLDERDARVRRQGWRPGIPDRKLNRDHAGIPELAQEYRARLETGRHGKPLDRPGEMHELARTGFDRDRHMVDTRIDEARAPEVGVTIETDDCGLQVTASAQTIESFGHHLLVSMDQFAL